MRYNPANIEPKWQRVWRERKVFQVPADVERLKDKPKFYVLDMFPYPSGAGLHVGHPEGYTATDVIARLKRMRGYNVLHPMGWDAFGLPTERAAIREGQHPAAITRRNVANFRRQIERLGFSYDWSREIDTSHPAYTKWTQWIFLKLYEKGLAYQADVAVNWCPALGTVLANEEVKDGRYVETGDPVRRRRMKQWMLRITDYAEQLLAGLDKLDWPDHIKQMQRNWIGKSEGVLLRFPCDLNWRDAMLGCRDAINRVSTDAERDALEVFTTCPHTVFGVTFCVVAPEHPLVEQLTTPENEQAVRAYVEQARNRSERERTGEQGAKTGVFTGGYVVHPVTGAPIPVWVADYVLAGYGTGAVMGVPGHDARDHAFARARGLPIKQVVDGGDKSVEEEAYEGDGVLVNSEWLNGLTVQQAKHKAAAELERLGGAKRRVHYRLRDWLFSRQRYWGEPFPLAMRDDGTVVPLDADALPITLPHMEDITPTSDGQPPLARAPGSWREVTLPDGTRAKREVHTMPQWAGSCWYYLRYLDPRNDQAPFSPEAERYWMPVDLYIGGVEHAVLHLLYARFWHHVLYDCGLVHTREPFAKLFNQGMILATSYRDAQGKYYPPDQVRREGDRWVVKQDPPERSVARTGVDSRFRGNPGDQNAYDVPSHSVGAKRSSFQEETQSTFVVEQQMEKMSKSKHNVVNPDDIVRRYGADALRLYELFMGPLQQVKVWQGSGVEGVRRFLDRVWRLVVDEETGQLNPRLCREPTTADATSDEHLAKRRSLRSLHRVIKQVTEETEALRFNTAIAHMMEFVNELTAAQAVADESTVRRDAIHRVSTAAINREMLLDFLKILAPYAPHIAEELWRRLGQKTLLAQETWPTYDPTLLECETVSVVVQVNGKKRDVIAMPKGSDRERMEKQALASPQVAKFLRGKKPKKVIVVPERLVNVVA
ncbi:MAG: leucine--tRNA ligase [Myxococcota bacterium]